MASEEKIQFNGEVLEALPNAMFKIRLEDNGHEVLGHLSGKMRKNNIKVLPGDSIQIEVSSYDLSRGRIIVRNK